MTCVVQFNPNYVSLSISFLCATCTVQTSIMFHSIVPSRTFHSSELSEQESWALLFLGWSQFLKCFWPFFSILSFCEFHAVLSWWFCILPLALLHPVLWESSLSMLHPFHSTWLGDIFLFSRNFVLAFSHTSAAI